MRPDFFRSEVLGRFLGPEADGVVEVEQLVAENFRSRLPGLRGYYVGDLVLIIKQDIAKAVEELRSLIKGALPPDVLGGAGGCRGLCDLFGRGDRQGGDDLSGCGTADFK